MPEYPFDLADQVAVITGGGTGIGAATARLLSKYGAQTVIASRKMDNLERVAKAITQETGRRCLPVATDVRVEEQVSAMVKRSMDEFGRIDILVNNAGGSYLFPLADTSVDQWDNMVSLNLRGPYVCTREVGPHMIEQGHGAIINISSGAGVTGVRGGAAYSSAKAGLQMFTRVVAAEWGRFGIRANCLAVGAIASEGALRSWSRFTTVEEMGKGIPLRRVGKPEDVAYPILFLACDASQYVSGETFAVNGGPTMGGLQDTDD